MMTTAITTCILAALALVWAVWEFERVLRWQAKRDRLNKRLDAIIGQSTWPVNVPVPTAGDLEEWRVGRWD